jgi:transcriptional regulator with XRE-family HTH domain
VKVQGPRCRDKISLNNLPIRGYSAEKVRSDIDKTIGHRLRSFRLAAKMSQTDLGNFLGVTFQQIQKYENGNNRLSGSRLIQAAAALNVMPGDILGVVEGNNRNGNNNDHDPFAALAEPAVNLMVRAMMKLSVHQRRATAHAMTDLIEAFTLK